jgi:hypothetical protein
MIANSRELAKISGSKIPSSSSIEGYAANDAHNANCIAAKS